MGSLERVFVTGSTGFIAGMGQDDIMEGGLVAELLKKHEVYVLVRPIAEFKPDKKALDGVNIEYGDLTDFLTVDSIVRKVNPDVILHLGARTPVSFSFDQPMDYQSINFLGTAGLVTAARGLPSLEKFIFASTMESYGWQPPGRLITENATQNPASPYAVSKVAAEHYVKMAGRAFGMPYIIMRACNTYGGKPFDTIIEYLTNSMLAGATPHIGMPDAVRDFIYVSDHTQAYLKAIKHEFGGKEERLEKIESDPNHFAFNFGWGLQLNIKDIAEKIRKLTGYSGEIKMGFPPDYPNRIVTEPYLSLDATKARKLLGWEPEFDIDAGLRKTVEYWKAKMK